MPKWGRESSVPAHRARVAAGRSLPSRPDVVRIGRRGGIREVGGERARLDWGRNRSPTGPRRFGGALTAIHGT
ncbi:MAG: hypothetical protein ACK52I_06320 [Pseudomonadota bacterium]